jgi:hypothetical protein
VQAWIYVLIAMAVYLRPDPIVVSAIQNSVGVVFAAAGEIPPDPAHDGWI